MGANKQDKEKRSVPGREKLTNGNLPLVKGEGEGTKGQLPRETSKTQRESRPRWAREESGTGRREPGARPRTERLHGAAAQQGDGFLDLRESGILALENVL